MEIVYFLLYKLYAATYMLFIIAAPLVVFGFVLACAFSARWSRTVFVLVCILPLIAYYDTAVLPPYKLERTPTRLAYEMLRESFDEFKVKQGQLNPERINQVDQIRRFELIDWNPPKHFYVTFKDVETGYVYEHQYVSKHCNMHRELRRGEQFNMQVQIYAWSNNPSSNLIEFKNLYEVFCK